MKRIINNNKNNSIKSFDSKNGRKNSDILSFLKLKIMINFYQTGI